MARNSKSNGDVRRRIEAVLDASMTAADIARIVDCNDSYVLTVAHLNGVTLAHGTQRPHAVNGPWTEVLVARLRSLYMTDGMSCARIAAEISMTRNAVIGKIHRLGWVRPARPNKKTIEAQRTRNMGGQKSTAPKLNPESDIPPPVKTDVARLTFKQMTAGKCWFPVGDPRDATFGFCGAKRIPNSSYCHEHYVRCSVQLEGRKVVPANDRERVDA